MSVTKVSTRCPECDLRLRLEPQLLGETVHCPACGKAFVVTRVAFSPPTDLRRAPAPGSASCDHELLARAKSGDQAAAEIHRRFASRLVALARNQLDPRIRQKVDPEDVVQSVFGSFFARHAGGEFEIADDEGLWALLALITVRKCGHKVERFTSARRSIDAEVNAANVLDGQVWEAMSRDPTASHVAIVAETLEGVMRQLEPRQRQIVTLVLQGVSEEEIAREAACSSRTIRRALLKARLLLEAQSK